MTGAAVKGVEAVTDVERAAVSSGILGGMAAPRTERDRTKPVLKNPTKHPPSESEGRRKSLLTQAGEEASRLARRQLLLGTLTACGWNLSKTAEALQMTATPDVIRAIRELDLDKEYEAAKERGDVVRGRRPEE